MSFTRQGYLYGICIVAIAAHFGASSAAPSDPAASGSCTIGDAGACGAERFCKLPDGACQLGVSVGTCADEPDGCPENLDPVCGCDGVTYSNSCEADAAGVSIVGRGACCNGFIGLSCEAGEFCRFPDGMCSFADHFGSCAGVPGECPAVFDPVCGCDGVTYSNRCEADRAGMAIDRAGKCDGAICTSLAPDACGPGRFCKFAEGQCFDEFVEGECRELPDACTEQYDPVCGCDANTYDNECFAEAAGVSVGHRGVCCGGITGVPCEDGEFCKMLEGTCLVADGTGICIELPLGCPDNVDPVCDCDGVTYGNPCEADAVGVSIVGRGQCCGGVIGTECDDGFFCKHPRGTCSFSDQYGTCAVVPKNCPEDIYDPVCGCDGVTYVNSCEADFAGVSVDHARVCAVGCGDVNNDGGVDLLDIFCVLDAFAGISTRCSAAKADLYPCPPDGRVDIFDLFVVLDAFAGRAHCCSEP